jgi:hypothetical protein
MTRNALRLMLVCAIGACTVAPSGGHDPLQGEAVGEIAASGTDDVIPIPAALSADPAAVDDAIRPRACIADFTCPDPKSCGTWSIALECDEQCLPQLCQGGAEGVLGRGFSNSFRDCTLGNGSACREWRVTTFTFCGC